MQQSFAGTFSPETVQRFVVDSLQRLMPTAKVTTHLPVLAEKFAKERLFALDKVEGSIASDVVITMGCGDACPVYPGTRYEDWELDDPAGLGVDGVRPIRDDIRTRVEALLSSLVPA